ncbi:hypothetical protein PFICI_07483 [Pestalotiopsis fici W106-1]|uniref:Uncharacterized protein n=1 Tax=Pestalotiopsis fici (strain W106-1 / CGMCC3.15140) TaxID=1229662 RepID=W3X1R1_PESFW|nr:uncharacterized protein PFICI_07483 [Pestalotiopsis fici W106-1]ETS79954.1 hypothetical protein PFICI_07483 [Pestalotiopsis fici W106-1]
MAAAQAKDPLDVLQAMFREALVQTGKAIKASQKDGTRNGASAGVALRTKMPETMKTYHYALDDIESEITRAKAVLLRDLQKLQAARAPVVVPSPVAPPAPMVPEPQQPAALMMDMPSAAAHTVNTNINFQPTREETKRAPFPDMGMGLSSDVPDLSSDMKPPTASPRPASASGKTGVVKQGTPPIKQSPKLTQMNKITPVPPPQVPQPSAMGPATQKAVVSPPQPAAAQVAQDSSLDAMLALPPTGGAATADMTGGELNFTNMEFTLAPPSDGQSQNAPPAPMQEFDMSAFTTQDMGGDQTAMDKNNNTNNNSSSAAPANAVGTTSAKAAEVTAQTGSQDSMYDLSNIDNGNGDQMDLDLSLGGGGEVHDSTFNDLFFEDADGGMGQFDDAFFGLE